MLKIIINKVIVSLDIEDTLPIEYVLPRRFFRRTETDREHKAIAHEIMVQNDRGGDVENHHQQNHCDSPASEPLIEHTDDEFKVKLTNTNIYNNYGDLVKVYRDGLIERLSHLLLFGASAGLYILLKDVVVWVRKDCGLRVTKQDIKSTVARYMRGRLEIANDVIYACSQQLQGDGEDRRESIKQNAVEYSLWKHGLSQNARSAHERPETVVNVIGPEEGVSVNTEGVPIINSWTINVPIIGMAC